MPTLPAHAFRRADESPDEQFYQHPRLVTHIDAGAVAAVTDLYRAHVPEGGAVLDLMSSWVSHLPPEATYARVAGLGMNAEELEANPRLSEWAVQDLNARPALPYADGAFDAALCCVSVQYLTRPVEVFADVARVLRPGAPFVVTFSNRCFPTKAVLAWRSLDDAGHAALVSSYVDEAGGFDAPETTVHRPAHGDPLIGVTARRAA
ncbi:methyltransferase domain-containing protein [Rubrivirga sp. S365]|uniref:Methyltransferase domain-containing protein n=1 Tax=Rubrivirga litoralis TaxID=3075598 RepID=A0ABU3BMC1_9BACT|nr:MULTISPECIES: methyltransferase domain-containing protein [unclassified Rubrivirga]MDT0630380.1 methyltransferase domain-containing protein [Rubrivirga sp. F394]MDT7855891.1 methyltransferase domain-containing protein [Rubrivirga sp. S365]